MISILLLCLFFQCSRSPTVPAESLTNTYFELLAHHDFKNIGNLYATQFFEGKKISYEAWQTNLTDIFRKLGDLKKYELVSYTEYNQVQSGEPGLYTIFNYQVTYANDLTQESFIIYQAPGKASFQIFSWSINAEKLDLPSY